MVRNGCGLFFCGNWRKKMPMVMRNNTTASQLPSAPLLLRHAGSTQMTPTSATTPIVP